MKQKIKDYLDEIAYEKGVQYDELTDLFQNGMLDSMGFIMLLSFLQDEFNIEFTEEDMNAEYFNCLNSIMEFCNKKIQ